MTPLSPPPELLAPAGDRECVQAAIENGADAVYFGLDSGFNARARADNFQADELPRLMRDLRQRGVKGYITLNTLAFTDELPAVEQLIRTIAAAGVDAVLVQDIGVARLVRKLCPELPLHASTQMTMTSAECIQLAEELGMQRVVVARELSMAELRQIALHSPMPLEVFVHGALCVAYSGQCLTSESLGGRSANRGQCAQACRLPYEVIADGRDVPLGETKYLLSPQDLAAYELIPELLDIGICSFKIEGRLKTPEYVANITRHYRQAIDLATRQREVSMSPEQRYEMEMSFSRGFSPGWLNGCDHKMLVPGASSAKRGVLLGTVQGVHENRVMVALQCEVAAGDGVVFEGDRARGEEQGGRVYDVRDEPRSAPRRAELSFASRAIDFSRIHQGQRIWKTDDPHLNRRLRQSYQRLAKNQRVALDLEIECEAGRPLTIRGRAANGATCHVMSPAPLEVARKHVVTPTFLREQLGRLGGTIYRLRDLKANIQSEPMIPLSVMGQLRREMVTSLNQPVAIDAWPTSDENILEEMRRGWARQPETSFHPTLSVLCRSLEQIEATLAKNVGRIYAEFQDIRQYAQAVARCQASRTEVYLATPRIQKPGEAGLFRALAKHSPDGLLVRNFAGLRHFVDEGFAVVADFSLNVANELTAEYLIQAGARRVTASYDLNRDQLLNLVRAVPPLWLEIVAHQHMSMFHMEHCVFCAVLSPGTNKTNCGRPCDTQRVELRDRIGMEHPLTADVGCRNTLYNAVPQSSAEIVGDLRSHGVRDFRIELLHADAAETQRTIQLYQHLLDGEVSGCEVWQRLRATNRVGVTRGTLESKNPLAIL